MMASVTGWFDTHRSLAVSLVSAGMGIAPMTMSPLAAWLVSLHDWRTSLQIIAALVAAVMIPVALLVRRPPALAAATPQLCKTGGAGRMSVGDAVRSPQFIVLVLTNFFCCATHSGPIIHTVSYAVSCGIPLIAAVSIYSLEGLAGMGGRIVFGISATGSAPSACSCGIAAQAFGALAYVFVRDLGSILRGGGVVRLHLCGHHAVICGDRAREFSAADDGHGDRRHGDGRQPRHGRRGPWPAD